LTEPVAAVALGAVDFILRWIIFTAFAPIWGDDEAGWGVAEEVRQQNWWWVEAATFCSTASSVRKAGMWSEPIVSR